MPSALHLVPHARRSRYLVGAAPAMIEPPPPTPGSAALLSGVSPRITVPVIYAIVVGGLAVYVAAFLGSPIAWKIGGAAAFAMLGYGYATGLGTGWVDVNPPAAPPVPQ